MGISVFLSRSPGQLNWGSASLGHGPHSSIFSPTATTQSRVLRAPSAGCWFSLQHLISNWSELQLLNRGFWGAPLLGAGSLYSILSPYNNMTSTHLPVSVTISHSIQPLDSQGYILIFLDRMHLLFTRVHFLFWQLSRVGGQYATVVFFDVWMTSFFCQNKNWWIWSWLIYQKLGHLKQSLRA